MAKATGNDDAIRHTRANCRGGYLGRPKHAATGEHQHVEGLGHNRPIKGGHITPSQETRHHGKVALNVTHVSMLARTPPKRDFRSWPCLPSA